jgi:hypothetical protein
MFTEFIRLTQALGAAGMCKNAAAFVSTAMGADSDATDAVVGLCLLKEGTDSAGEAAAVLIGMCYDCDSTPMSPFNYADRGRLEAIFLSRAAVLRNQTNA